MRKIKQIIQLVVMVNGLLLAETLEVGGSGSYSTVQSAINAASDGDTILVASGTYVEKIETKSKLLFIIGEGYSNTLIYSSGVTISVNSESTIEGFTIESTANQAISIQSNYDHYFNKCIIKSSMSSGQSDQIGAVITFGGSGDSYFNNCIFRDSNSAIIISDNEEYSDVIVKNSIFYNNTQGIRANTSNATVTVQNSIFKGNSQCFYLYGGKGVTSAYNLFVDNNNTNGNGSLGLLEGVDPKFIDISKSYVLASDSPTINKGNPSSLFNDPDGTRNDMGVYGGAYSWSAGPAITDLSVSFNSVEQGTAITITGTAKSK